MAIPLVNSVASWFLKKRFHQIDLFLKYPHEVQNELLMNLLSISKDTEIGKAYDFRTIRTYHEFAQRVPVSSYEDYQNLIERSRKGEKNIFWPKPIGGSKELYEENGTTFGDLSAILIDNMPFWAEFSSTPGNKVSLMSDWEYKMQAIVNETVNENVTSLAGVPSWMLVLLNNVLESTDNKIILDVWPNLEVYFHGGVSFLPYVDQYKSIIPSKSFKYYEIYNASEGFFAIQDRNHSNELLLMLDYGIFYEFIPMQTHGTPTETLLPLSEVKKGVNYAIVITTNAGLWRYKIGDTVMFTSTAPYRIKVTGRTKHFINVFGEELIIENTDKALKIVAKKTNSEIVDYTVAPIFMEGKSKGAHEWIIEFKTPPKDLNYFGELLDNSLKSLNSDYESKRYNNITLDKPKIHAAKQGLFYKWMKRNNKLGGQHKVPRLSNSRQFLEALLKID